ncbi:MAG TPA: hypothetical protein VFK89_10650, partial [Actinomycetota bacterium]|nr:hypothetical protein [Actinomycetota bacterium]
MKGLVVALLLVATACSSGPSTGVAAEPSPSPTPAPTETPRAISFPGPDRSAPYKPGVLAREIRVTEHKLHRAIAVWQDAGGRRRSAEGHTVALGALWQQKLTRRLVARSRILDQVLGALSASLRHVVSARVRAGAGLRALTSPVTGH